MVRKNAGAFHAPQFRIIQLTYNITDVLLSIYKIIKIKMVLIRCF